MYTADALAEPMGSLAPPDSIRAGRNRTWSASDFPQLTQVGMRSSPCPLPSVTREFAESMGVKPECRFQTLKHVVRALPERHPRRELRLPRVEHFGRTGLRHA